MEREEEKKVPRFFSASEQFKPQCESNEDVNVDVTKKKITLTPSAITGICLTYPIYLLPYKPIQLASFSFAKYRRCCRCCRQQPVSPYSL